MDNLERSPADGIRRPRGRPRATEPHAGVTVWLPASAHDRLIQLAKREEQSISATVRQLLILRLK